MLQKIVHLKPDWCMQYLNQGGLGDKGRNILIRAIQARDTELIKALLDTGLMECNRKDKEGHSALWHAVSWGDYQVIKWLLKNGGKVTCDMVQEASSKGYDHIVAALLVKIVHEAKPTIL